MKSKNPEDLSADSLVKMAKESHRKVMQEAESRERAHKEKVASLTEAEKRLKAEIATAKERIETMILGFDKIDLARIEAGRADSRTLGTAKGDLKAGKITMNQFLTQNESEKLLVKEALEKILKKLGSVGDAIREKGKELARLELSLYETQSAIFGLLSFPVKSLRRSYRDLGEMLDFQFEGMTKDGHSAQSLMTQKKNELTLIEKGVSVMSSGYTWMNITLKEAYHLRLSPIMPREYIPSLLKQLDEIEPGEEIRLTVVFHQPGSSWPGDVIEIREEL